MSAWCLTHIIQRMALAEDELQAIVDAIVEAVPTEAIYVFGSFARGEQGPQSDLDVFVRQSEPGAFALSDQSRLVDKLSGLLGRRVDLVTSVSGRSRNRTFETSVNEDKAAIFSACPACYNRQETAGGCRGRCSHIQRNIGYGGYAAQAL